MSQADDNSTIFGDQTSFVAEDKENMRPAVNACGNREAAANRIVQISGLRLEPLIGRATDETQSAPSGPGWSPLQLLADDDCDDDAEAEVAADRSSPLCPLQLQRASSDLEDLKLRLRELSALNETKWERARDDCRVAIEKSSQLLRAGAWSDDCIAGAMGKR